MITATHVKKRFDKVVAVKDVTVTIKKGEVFGLIGTNGAGKSTFLRMACGVLKPDSGEIMIDEQPIYGNPKAKADIFYISDDQYFLPNSTPMEMAKFYKDFYIHFDNRLFQHSDFRCNGTNCDPFGNHKCRDIKTSFRSLYESCYDWLCSPKRLCYNYRQNRRMVSSRTQFAPGLYAREISQNSCYKEC